MIISSTNSMYELLLVVKRLETLEISKFQENLKIAWSYRLVPNLEKFINTSKRLLKIRC